MKHPVASLASLASLAAGRSRLRLLRSTLAAGAAVISLIGCHRDSGIIVYRIPKEAPPPAMANAASPSTAEGTDIPTPAPLAPPEKASLHYEVPPGWREQPLTAMRAASFKVAGPNGQEADVAVVFLSGLAGGDLANVNRWREQLKLEPIDEQALAQSAEHVQANGHDFLVVDLVSATPIGQPPLQTRVLGAILKETDRSWFVKMTGEDALVASQKNAFAGFLSGLIIP